MHIVQIVHLRVNYHPKSRLNSLKMFIITPCNSSPYNNPCLIETNYQKMSVLITTWNCWIPTLMNWVPKFPLGLFNRNNVINYAGYHYILYYSVTFPMPPRSEEQSVLLRLSYIKERSLFSSVGTVSLHVDTRKRLQGRNNSKTVNYESDLDCPNRL